ncbi:adenylyltransferase/cytidyltransferase family protein [Limosilactobacillus reuteri]|nr:adenylyltransferase/cytidyltransferase family protein [Limosilactobacillus reuteri]
MNANPFTLGHRYLVEQAAKENDRVYVFVVQDNVSLFTTDERRQLVVRRPLDDGT